MACGQWRSGGGLPLVALGLQFNEVALCRGLLWLLDPEGGHGMGAHPLHAFLRSLEIPVLESAPVVIHVEESRADARSDMVLRVGASATLVEGEAVDLYHFTSVIMREVDEAGRLRIVEMMWELAYVDGQISEFEDNVVWRAADLLGVSSRDRIDLKHRVATGEVSTTTGG